MAKSKRSVAKKKAAKKAINKKSVQQQIWRLQNKLDQKRISLEDKRELEKKLQKEKKKIGYEGLTAREKERYKKENRSISSKLSRLRKIAKDLDSSNKEKNQAFKDMAAVSKRKNEIDRISKKKRKTATKEKKSKEGFIDFEREEVSSDYTVWEFIDKAVKPVLKAAKIKSMIFETSIGVFTNVLRKEKDLVMSTALQTKITALAEGSKAFIRVTESIMLKSMTYAIILLER